MNTSPITTRFGYLGAAGTGLASVGTLLAAGASTTPGAPSWLPTAALVLVAVGGALSVTAKALGGLAARDNTVSDEAAGAAPPGAP